MLKLAKVGVTACLRDMDVPHQIYNFDKWKCPDCGIEILLGAGEAIEGWEDNFEAMLAKVEVSFR
jgi:hypothetical protein